MMVVSLLRIAISVYNSYEISSAYSNKLDDKSAKSLCNPDDKSLNLINATPPSIKAVIKVSERSLMSRTVSLLKSDISLDNSLEV